jgi:hypothetical protein
VKVKPIAFLACGLVIGLWVGWVSQGFLQEKPREEAVAAPPRATTSEGPTSPVSLPLAPPTGDEGALAQERAARLSAEKERDELRAELARVKSGTPVTARAERRRREEPKPYAPEIAATRLQEIAPRLDEVLKKHDWRGAAATLRELARMGRPAWPLIDRLVNAPRGDGLDDEGDNAPDLSDVRDELIRLCASGELRELTMDALLDGSSYSLELRHLSAQAGGALTATPDELTALAAKVGTEHDPQVLNGILAVLANSNALDPRALLAAYQLQGSSDARTAIARVLIETPETPADTLALLAQSPDDAVRRYATFMLLSKNPPVQGYLVSGIVDGSQAAAAGIKEGDIIVSYNGSDVKSVVKPEK